MKYLGIALCVIGAAVFGVTLIHATLYAPQSEVSLAVAASRTATSTVFADGSSATSTPMHIRIPSIGVDTNVQKVGLTYIGNMGTPNNYTDTGWYKYGTVPGQIGSAVIDGHVDNGLGTPAVFENLKNLQVGDSVYVDMSDGTTLQFIVKDIEIYYYKSVPLTQVFNQSDAVRLNLITCTGNWVTADKTDDHRVVVYTELVK